MDKETVNFILKLISAIGAIGVVFWAILEFGERIFENLFKEVGDAKAQVEIVPPPDDRREYIKELIAHLEDQKKHALVFLSFNLAVLAITADKMVFSDKPPILIFIQHAALVCGLLSFILSAFLFRKWMEELHVLRIIAIDLYITQNINESRRVHHPGNEFFLKKGWIIKLARRFMNVGILCYVLLIFISISRQFL